MKILGINDSWNSSVCLLEDGKVRVVLQEERFTNFKNESGFPINAMKRVLELAKLDLSDIDEVAFGSSFMIPYGRVNIELGRVSYDRENAFTKMSFMRFTSPSHTPYTPLHKVFYKLLPDLKKALPGMFAERERQRNEIRSKILRGLGYEGEIVWVDHHAAHGACAYWGSPFPRDEPVLQFTSDAAGDDLSATVRVVENGVERLVAQTHHHNSVGYIYAFTTRHMGMKSHEHEYRVMGLAPYANPKRAEPSRKVFESYVGLSKDGLSFQRKIPEPLQYIAPRLHQDLHYHQFDNIARGLQDHFESLMTGWVRSAIRKTGVRRVAVGGGSFMNVAANKLIREMPEVESFFPMPSSGDESTSVGAAMWLYAQRMLEAGQEPNIEPLGSLYLGDEPTEKEIGEELNMLDGTRLADHLDMRHTSHVDDLAADLILKGEIVARVRGPMEFGQRALMNRSILCDASDLRNVGRINATIKSRAFWLPFAATIKEDRMADYLVRPKYAPYMVETFDSTPLAQADLIAGMHQADKTTRPQVLRESWNPGAFRILDIYERETGRGGLLNTSANITSEPIVHGAKEALSMFIRSDLKHLVLGEYLLSKR
jgi:carbamoyltransferase